MGSGLGLGFRNPCTLFHTQVILRVCRQSNIHTVLDKVPHVVLHPVQPEQQQQQLQRVAGLPVEGGLQVVLVLVLTPMPGGTVVSGGFPRGGGGGRVNNRLEGLEHQQVGVGVARAIDLRVLPPRASDIGREQRQRRNSKR